MSTAITFSEYGGPEVLTLSEVPVPEPAPGQIHIRVRAAAVNPIDVRIRAGIMQDAFPAEFPHLPGWDVAGVVDKVGEGAGFAVGDEVFGVASAGGYSEYALLDRPFAKPRQLSFETAAGMITVGTVAEQDIERVDRLGATAARYGEGWAERVKGAAPSGVDFVLDACGAGVLAESVTLVGDAGKVITIADPSFARHGVRFTGMDPKDRFPEALPQPT
ncbi:alcohol dehydrogenase catalytic domain-containing protein [Nonomuraea angiospora]|uniref:alcohol dehydrogenase catalytic domain-containing protein n=1 Tax=Nonomuraea angiospora TaxID=46172 RepID=UPI0033F5D0F3